MSHDYEVPPSLQEWAELNEKADQAAKLEDDALYEKLGAEIQDAWESAPLRDRTRVSWELLKKVWRERHDALDG